MKLLNKQDNAHEFNHAELTRLLGEYEGKAILALQAWLFYPYADTPVATIAIYKKGETQPDFLKVSVGRPLSNKRIVVAQSRLGHRMSRGFIPLAFDSFEALSEIEKIAITWKYGNGVEFTVAEYEVSFEKPVQKAVYGLWSYEHIIKDTLTQKLEQLSAESEQPNDAPCIRQFYDDMYFMEDSGGEIALKAEFHEKDSKFVLAAFEDEDELPPAELIAIIVENLAEELKNPDKGSTAIAFYHSVIRLDDERILHR